MKIFAIFALSICAASAAMADMREMSQAELRGEVAANRAISTRNLIVGVENFTGGEVVEIRAFANDGIVIYRILFQKDDGSVDSVIVDGVSGTSVSPNSTVGQQVSSLASASSAAGTVSINANNQGRSTGVGNRNNGNRNNGNGGNGNSGGGNGNSGNNKGRND